MGKGQGLGATAAASELRRNCPTGWQYSGPLMVSHMSVCLCRHVINFLNHCMSTYFYVHWLELQMLCNAFWYFFLMILQKFWAISNNDDYGLRTNYFLHTLWNQFIATFWKSSTGPPKLIACNLWTAFKRLPDERDLAPHNRRMLLEAKRSGWNVFYGKVMLKAQSWNLLDFVALLC